MANWQKSILGILQSKIGTSSSGSFASVTLYGGRRVEDVNPEYSVISFSYPFRGFSGLFLSDDLAGYDFSRVLDVLLNNSMYVQGLSSTMYFRPGILFDSPENSSISCNLRYGVEISISTGKDDYIYLFFPGRVFKGTLGEIFNNLKCGSLNFANKTFTSSGNKSNITITYFLKSIIIRTPQDFNLSNKFWVGTIFVLGLLYVPTENTIYPAVAFPNSDPSSNFYVLVKHLGTNVKVSGFHYLTAEDLTDRYQGSGIESILGYFSDNSTNNISLLNKLFSFYSYPWSIRRNLDDNTLRGKTLINIFDYTDNLNIVSVNWAIVPQKDYFVPLALASARLKVEWNGNYGCYEASVESIGSLFAVSGTVFVETGSVGGYPRGVLVAPKYGKHISSDVFGLGDIIGFSDIPGGNLLNVLSRIKSSVASTVGEAISSSSTYVYEDKKLLALDDTNNRLSVDLLSTLSLGSGFRNELEMFDNKTYPETVIDVPLSQDLNISDLKDAIQSAIRDTTKVRTARLKFYTDGQNYLDIHLDLPYNDALAGSDLIISDSYGSKKFPMYTIPLPQVPRIILDFSYYSYVKFSVHNHEVNKQQMDALSRAWKLQVLKNGNYYDAISRFALVFKIMRNSQYVELYGLNYCSSGTFPVKIAIGHNYTHSTATRYSMIKVKNCCIRDFDIFGSKGYRYGNTPGGNSIYTVYHYPIFGSNTSVFFYDVYLSIENSTVRVYPYGYIANVDEPISSNSTDFYSGYMIGWWPGCEPFSLYLSSVRGG